MWTTTPGGCVYSGHAHQSELREVLQLVKPRHFLPVHGEAAFLYAHAELAQDLGCRNTTVIRNGQMLGVGDIRSREHVSMGTAAVRLLSSYRCLHLPATFLLVCCRAVCSMPRWTCMRRRVDIADAVLHRPRILHTPAGVLRAACCHGCARCWRELFRVAQIAPARVRAAVDSPESGEPSSLTCLVSDATAIVW